MKIPVFVSSPTTLSPSQAAARAVLIRQLEDNDLEPRALGRSDYPTELPLREVLLIARHCSGGIVLGFEQFRAEIGIIKPGTPDEKRVSVPTPFPTAWNHLESGILFGLRLPILVFRENGISGGVFDNGVSDVFVHSIPPPEIKGTAKDALRQIFQRWAGKVRDHYYYDFKR
ncbi:hypothetical protein SAMN05216404_11657 [Nitrosospira multiformis]|uniref:Uncharacterized protein n=1 Tax=Nitrosospira multiformis TaxID=1231 RepID=A0A1H8NI52_9PROT|nr:hypothetical protein [Nitrosospira multiformis]SEO29242.1 hypothetical protein SAMN05216404_11657 [Nitrosospira multiformis]